MIPATSPNPRPCLAGPWLAVAVLWLCAGPAPAEGGKETKFEPDPGGIVFGITFSPDGKQVALACGDATINLHDWPSGKRQTQLQGHKVRVWMTAFSPDGKLLASCSGEYAKPDAGGELKLWDLKTGKEKASLEGHKGLVFSVAFSPDGKTLLSGGWDGAVKLWDVEKGTERKTLQGHTGPVRRIVFAPDGKSFATASFDGTVRFWDAASGKHKKTIEAHKAGVQCVAFSPDGRCMATCDRPGGSSGGVPAGEIKLWDLTTGQVRARLENKGPVLWLDFSPDGWMLASGGGWLSQFSEVKVYEVVSGQVRASPDGHREWVESVQFSPDGKALITSGGFTQGRPGEVRVWRADSPLKRKADEPTAAELKAHWEALADNKDAAKVYEAVLALAAAPKAAVPLLKEKVRPAAAADPKRIDQLIAELDSEAFKVRDNAAKELAQLGDAARLALKKAAQEAKSPDLKLRAGLLLRQLEMPITAAGLLRPLRAVEVLERAGTPEARQMLAALAKGGPRAQLTRAASAALNRLNRRDESKP